MRELTMQEMEGIEGAGFWSGFGCGMAAVTAFVMFVSPEPFSKVALLGYAGTVARCATAF